MTQPEPINDAAPLVDVRNLRKCFSRDGSVVAAVDDVSFTIRRGETFGLVGESGCGKSTTGRCLLRLIEPTAGQVLFEGRDLLSLGREDLRQMRRKMQIVFQDPYSSLNPRMTAGQTIGEPLIIHKIGNAAARRERVAELLTMVGLAPEHAGRYPHEFSGGQRQRIGIARALALSPQFIVCDEPVSALDVSIQAQIVNLLQDLQEQLGLTYLFISHGLAVVRHISTNIGIMYRGRLIEMGPGREIFNAPAHPYTRALLGAIPVPDPSRRDSGKSQAELRQAPGEEDPDASGGSEPGCRYRAHCPISEPECGKKEPPMTQIGPGHFAACPVLARRRQ